MNHTKIIEELIDTVLLGCENRLKQAYKDLRWDEGGERQTHHFYGARSRRGKATTGKRKKAEANVEMWKVTREELNLLRDNFKKGIIE